MDNESLPAELSNDLFSPVREPRIVMTWLLRLRWLAIAGQLAATAAAYALGLHVPLTPLLIVVSITAITNGVLWRWITRGLIATWLILAVLLLDMSLLTTLLLFAGGPDNPFSSLYLIHVAMAVTTLGGGWTWVVVGAAAGMYGLLFFLPHTDLPLNDSVRHFGRWTNIVLIGGLIAYFSARVNRSLRRRELEVYALKERNARHEKMAMLTTLAAGAAHELGTPLATIAVVAKELELAMAKLDGMGELVEDTQLIRQECNRCRFILDRMRVEVASDTRDAATPMSELMQLLAMHLRDDERQRLKIIGAEDKLVIGAPCNAIEQSLTVMIRNAMDADPSGQTVDLTIRPTKDQVIFQVIDRGHGMPPEVLKRAGDPFFTTKEPGRGMGLGLFLVRIVAENYRGRFDLASTPGVGTTSTLELPRR